MTAAAEKGLSFSDSGYDSYLATAYIRRRINKELPGSSSVILEMSLAAVLLESKPYLRLHNCRSSDLLRASSFDASAPVLHGAVQLVLADPPLTFRRVKKSKISVHDSLSVKDKKNTVKLTADSLEPNENSILLCTAQQFAMWHTLFCAQKAMQNDGLTSSHASTPRDTFMVSPALLTFVEDPLHRRNNPERNSCTLAEAVQLALHVKRSGLPLAAEDGEKETGRVCKVRFPRLQKRQ